MQRGSSPKKKAGTPIFGPGTGQFEIIVNSAEEKAEMEELIGRLRFNLEQYRRKYGPI